MRPELRAAAVRSVTVKVADFGIVREYGEGELGTTGVGTVAYMSPERLHVEEGVGYSFVADVWAVGLIAGADPETQGHGRSPPPRRNGGAHRVGRHRMQGVWKKNFPIINSSGFSLKMNSI